MVRFFLSYASRTWRNMPNALPDFIRKLETGMQDGPYSNASIYRDKINLQEFQDWKLQLRKAVQDADATLVLLSRAWLESEVCWEEYDWSLTAPKIGPGRVKAIVLDTEALHDSDVPPAYADRKSELIHHFLTSAHQHDFENGYRDRIEHYFGPDKRDDGKKNEIVRSIVTELKDALEAPVAPYKAAPLAQKESKVVSIPLAKREYSFAQVLAGSFTCLATGQERVVERPFYIMTDPVPMSELSSEETPLLKTAGDLLRLSDVWGPDWGLPSETEWEWAMQGAGFGPVLLGGSAEHPLQLSWPKGGMVEPTSSLYQSARRGDVRATARQNLVSKFISGSGFGRRLLRYGNPIRAMPLRLVFRGNVEV